VCLALALGCELLKLVLVFVCVCVRVVSCELMIDDAMRMIYAYPHEGNPIAVACLFYYTIQIYYMITYGYIITYTYTYT